MAAYSLVNELLTGDVRLGSAIDPQKFVDDAYDEINVRLGMLYTLPIPVGTMPEHLVTLLRMINNRLASGRLIMAAAVGAEAREIHAYGQSLVEMAFADLSLILSGNIALEGATLRTDSNRNRAPGVINHDTNSSVDSFESALYRDPWTTSNPDPWRPGVM